MLALTKQTQLELHLCAAQQLLHTPLDREIAQVGVVLADTNEQDRHVRGVDDADQSADHVSNRIALGNDETIQSSARAKRSVEVPRLGNRICPHERLVKERVSIPPEWTLGR